VTLRIGHTALNLIGFLVAFLVPMAALHARRNSFQQGPEESVRALNLQRGAYWASRNLKRLELRGANPRRYGPPVPAEPAEV
jgi:hypothetical protein